MDGDRPELSLIQVLQESIGFVAFAIPMFILLLIPAVMTMLFFRHATTESSGILCLMISFVATVGAVFLLSRVGSKVFPADFTAAVSIYVFAGAGAMILWIRSRATNRVETPTEANHH